MKAALVQLNSSDDPVANLEATLSLFEQAKSADILLTPEVTNCVSTSRPHQMDVLRREEDDLTLKALQKQALMLGKWVLIGSLALKTSDPDGRFVNRSFLISPDGEITAKYDKIHMFDVTISENEIYRESAGYKPGTEAVLNQNNLASVGMTICYDLRFPHLFRMLAKAGAQIITVPSAFAVETGVAHWETLLRARAIETGAYILAPAQCGLHSAIKGKARKTYGHSMAIDPWGQVIGDGGTDAGVTFVDIDLDLVEQARHRIPALKHDRKIVGPKWKTPTKI